MGRSRNRANQRACRPRSPGCAPRSPQRPPPAAPVDHGTDPLKLWRVGGKPLPGDCSGRGPPPTRRRRPRSTPRQLLALDMQPPRGAATQQGLCSKRAAAEDRPPAGEVRQPSAQLGGRSNHQPGHCHQQSHAPPSAAADPVSAHVLIERMVARLLRGRAHIPDTRATGDVRRWTQPRR